MSTLMPSPKPVHVPDWMARSTGAIECETRLDAPASLVDKAAAPLSRDTLGSVLRGDWLGHALHPMLTDLPLGCWLGAGLLDLTTGKSGRHAAQRLVGLGLLMTPPTVAAGLVDAGQIDDPRARRVAAVHGAGNTVVAFLYFRSWRARHKQHHARGVLFGLAGAALAWYTGYLGGHLSFGRAVGPGLRGLAEHDGGGAADDIIDLVEAARVLDVTPAEVQRLVDGDLLVPVGDAHGSPRFRRSDVRAARLIGA